MLAWRRFNVLATTIGTIAFWKVAEIKTDPMEVLRERDTSRG
jgi:hypothetical protein